jgi:hypothetical protein
MAEDLSRRLEQAKRTKSILGIKITQGARGVNHSPFVDDTLLLGGASTIIARIFKANLDEFMKASRAKINRHKSYIYVWNTNSKVACIIALIL